MTHFISIFILVLNIIFYKNYTLLFRHQPRCVIKKVPCIIEYSSSRSNSIFSPIYLDGVMTVFRPRNMLNESILWSNGEDTSKGEDSSGVSSDNKQDDSKTEEPKDLPQEPETKDASVQTEPEQKETAAEEERKSTPGIPDPPHTTSRIPTYDEFARYRDSSRPPDSHYYPPPGPGPFDRRRRSQAGMTRCNSQLVISVLCVTAISLLAVT